MLDTIAILVGAGLFGALVYAAVVSHLEGEPRATRRSVQLAALLPVPYVVLGLVSFPHQPLVVGGLLAVTAVTALAFIVPVGRGGALENDTPRGRIDERDIMFSRYYLEEGSERFETYYATRPDKKEADDRFRALPGILGKGSGAYDPITFAAATASFITIAQTRPFVDGEVAEERVVADPGEITEFVKHWGLKLGALSIGVTELRDYHLYSSVGRGDEYGQQVELPHDYAVAFTVEMDEEMVDSAHSDRPPWNRPSNMWTPASSRCSWPISSVTWAIPRGPTSTATIALSVRWWRATRDSESSAAWAC